MEAKPRQKKKTKIDPAKMREALTQINTVSPLVGLMESLRKVDITSPEASLNSHSISDGNGGRIELVRELKGIKK
jgi:hypothetical protein